MKSLNFKMMALCLVSCCLLFSCKKDAVNSVEPDNTSVKEEEVLDPPVTVFAPGTHTFTDIHICYDDKIFLLEGGRLKRLINGELVNVALPESVYDNFDPKFLAISKNYTFYLRANTGIKVIKGGKEIGYYKVGQPPLQNFTTKTFGNFKVQTNETDNSITFGIVRIGFDSVLYTLGKITKNGQYGEVLFPAMEDQFMTAFGVGASNGELWTTFLEAINPDNFYDRLLKSTPTNPPFVYGNTVYYGNSPSNHIGYPDEGPIDDVAFGVMGGITISKDSKDLYFKTGIYNEEGGPAGVSEVGNVYKIINGVVTRLAINLPNKHLAVSNNGKVLYVAGDGLYKIDL